jgi:L-fucose mutarotase
LLKHIPSILSLELLKILMGTGHGGETAMADGNFPGASIAERLVCVDGLPIPGISEAILKLFPLDTRLERAVS